MTASTPRLPDTVRLDGDQTSLTADVQGTSGVLRTSGNGARSETALPASAHRGSPASASPPTAGGSPVPARQPTSRAA